MLGSCWELFRCFFCVKLRYHLEVVCASLFDRFLVDVAPPGTSKNLETNNLFYMFSHFSASSLKDALGVDLGRQNASEIDPKSVQDPSQNEVRN